MKAYNSKAVAQMQAGTKTKKSGITHMWLQDGDQFLVGTEEEITAEIIRREKLAAEQVAEADVPVVVFSGKFHRQTNEMVSIYLGDQEHKPSWFKRDHLLGLKVLAGDVLQLLLPDGFKYLGKTYKAK